MSTTEGLAAWDAAVSIPTLLGSLLSMTSTMTVILLWTFARDKKRRDFRYALILNLTVAEFMNSLNNSVSGIVVVSKQRSPIPGLLCNINGWAGQFSVVAVDFSILAITIVTLLTIQLRSSIIYASTTTKALICLAIWIVPLCTSIIAWMNEYYGPVSGNWCWIETRFARQRYILNHGWRITIFFISLCTYAFVFFYMVRRFRPQNLASLSGSSFDSFQHELESRHRNDVACGVPPAVQLEPLGTGPPPVPQRSGNMPGWGVSFILPRGLKVDTKSSAWHGPRTRTAHEESDNALRSPHPKQPASSSKEYGDMGEPSPSTMTSDTLHTPQHPTAQTPLRRPSRSTRTIDREVWRMLLLNMYPVTYLILWLPGMLNRITEGMGHAIHALVILQSSTQFIGFANATVYIYQEHGKDIRRYWDSARSPKSARHEVLPGNVDNRRVAQPENRRWTSISV